MAAQPKRTEYRHGSRELTANAAVEHRITRGRATRFVGQIYSPMIGDVENVTVLATAEEEGEPRPMLWTFRRGQGRVFGSVPGHYTHTLHDPLFRILILRGLAWTAGEDVRRMERVGLGEERAASPKNPRLAAEDAEKTAESVKGSCAACSLR